RLPTSRARPAPRSSRSKKCSSLGNSHFTARSIHMPSPLSPGDPHESRAYLARDPRPKRGGRSGGPAPLQLPPGPADLVLGDDPDLRPQDRRALEPPARLDERPVHLDQQGPRPERQAADLRVADAALIGLQGSAGRILPLAALDGLPAVGERP